MLSPSGQRLRHTFRKLPKASPRSPAKMVERTRAMEEIEYTVFSLYDALQAAAALVQLAGRVKVGKLNWTCMDLPPESPSAKDPTPQTTTDPARAAALFEQSAAIMARLRAPGGCPWDREQSFDSIRKYTLEEAYEVFDAIERRDFNHLSEELGDLLLQVLFYSEMAANEGHFTIAEVLDQLNRKLIRRHPHVFGDEASRAAGNLANVDAAVEGSSAAVLRNWEEIKTAEKQAAEKLAAGKTLHAADAPSAQKQPQSRLDGVLRSMPALAEAAKLGAKAQKSGFDWPSWRELLPKVAEETAELVAEAESDETESNKLARNAAVEAELGDLLFTVVNLGRHLGVDAEMALRDCNLRFRRRFSEMEQTAQRPLEDLSPPELEALWEQAKKKLADSAALELGDQAQDKSAQEETRARRDAESGPQTGPQE